MKRRTLLCSIAATVFVSKESSANNTKTGIASWYGKYWHGRKTASGERYNKNAFTCAYNNAPFGTRLKVTDLDTKKSVDVLVNDRIGHKGRIIDLSESAAKGLDLLKKGLACVSVTIKGIWLPLLALIVFWPI